MIEISSDKPESFVPLESRMVFKTEDHVVDVSTAGMVGISSLKDCETILIPEWVLSEITFKVALQRIDQIYAEQRKKREENG